MSKSSSKSSKESEPSGNTKKAQIPPARYWVFTLNNYTEEDIHAIEDVCSSKNIKYVFQKEIAPTTGTPHLQGYIDFGLGEKKRPKGMFNQKIHWLKAVGGFNDNWNYCTKKHDGGTGEFYTNFDIPEPLECPPIKEWCNEFIEIAKTKPDYRKIHWIWSDKGDTGKSTFCKYLCIKHDAVILSGSCKDMKLGLVNYMKDHNGKSPKIIVIDIPRSFDTDFLSYTGLEEIKNGCFFSSKCDSKMVLFNSPHIFIVANVEPDKDKLSKDRWVIKNID